MRPCPVLLIDLTTKARSYMCAADRRVDTKADIKLALDQLEIERARWPGYGPKHALVGPLAAFGDAATGADFESATRIARQPADAEPQALMLARYAVLRSLEAEFSARHLR